MLAPPPPSAVAGRPAASEPPPASCINALCSSLDGIMAVSSILLLPSEVGCRGETTLARAFQPGNLQRRQPDRVRNHRSAQQAAQRRAPPGIFDKHFGHGFVVRATGPLNRLACLTIRKMTNARITKLTTSFRKAPYAITGTPAALGCARESGAGLL